MGKYRKFLVALGGVAVAVGLEFGYDITPLVNRLVELATALLVFWVPNDQ